MRPHDTTPTLRSRIIRAGIWSLGGYVASQALRLGSNLIMTRLLVPEMFGIMAVANVILVGLHLFSDIGLNQGVIQSRRGHDPVYLNTAWTVQILRGALLCLIALGIARSVDLAATSHWVPAGSVYADPILPYVITVLAFNPLIGGFASTRLATANRRLALGRITLIEIASQTAALLFMISWALVDRSIWALVVGSLLAVLLKVVLSHTLLPGEANALRWDREAFREIFGFGKWIFLTSILGFLAANGDRLLLGGLTDPATLGLYAIAYFIVGALYDAFDKVASSVAFPALSEVVRDRPQDLKNTYYKFRLPFDAMTLLVMGGLLSAGHLIVDVLYDDRYSAAGSMIGILGIMLFTVRYTLSGLCFLALGRPKLLVPITLSHTVLLFGLMPPIFGAYGFDGALWVVGGSAVLSLPVILYLKMVNQLFDFWREVMVLPLVPIGYALGLGLDTAASRVGWLQ